MIDLIKNYASKKAELLKLQMIEKSSVASGNIAIIVITLFFALFFISLLNIGLGFLIGEYMDSYAYGFLILAGIYLLLLIIILLAKKSIKRTISNIIIQSINK